MPPETQLVIRRLLTNLAEMKVNDNTPRCVIRLIELTNVALCRHHRIALRNKVSLLVKPYPLKDCARSFAGPVKSEETVKVKLKRLPNPIPIREENEAHPGEQEVEAGGARITLSTSKVIY